MRMGNYTATMEEPTTAERLLEGAKRIGELAEKEAHEAEVNATISQNVIDLIKRNRNLKDNASERIWRTTSKFENVFRYCENCL